MGAGSSVARGGAVRGWRRLGLWDERREGMVGRRDLLRKIALVGDEMNWSCGDNKERENEIRCGR